MTLERLGSFYSPWPSYGENLNLQIETIRKDIKELESIVKNTLFNIDDTQPYYSQPRGVAGQQYGTYGFKNKFRVYYDSSVTAWKIQENTGTVASPTWVDFIKLNDSTKQVEISAPGGLLSDAGFYGPALKVLHNIKEAGVGAVHSFFDKDTLAFNVGNGFYLSQNKQGKPVVNFEVPTTIVADVTSYSKTSSLEWAVSHNLNKNDIIFQIYDSKGRMVLPDSSHTLNPNIAYFYFTTAMAGKVVIVADR